MKLCKFMHAKEKSMKVACSSFCGGGRGHIKFLGAKKHPDKDEDEDEDVNMLVALAIANNFI